MPSVSRLILDSEAESTDESESEISSEDYIEEQSSEEEHIDTSSSDFEQEDEVIKPKKTNLRKNTTTKSALKLLNELYRLKRCTHYMLLEVDNKTVPLSLMQLITQSYNFKTIFGPVDHCWKHLGDYSSHLIILYSNNPYSKMALKEHTEQLIACLEKKRGFKIAGFLVNEC